MKAIEPLLLNFLSSVHLNGKEEIMTYDGALVMPRNCVVMSEEEMTYTEGGLSIPNWLVSGAINFVISAVVGGIGSVAISYFRNQAKKYGQAAAAVLFSKTLKQKLIAKGIANNAAAFVCGLAGAFFEILTWATDPGGQLAIFFDGRDSKRNNGYLDI